MSLTPGTTLGRYQVLSVLGAGGMGEVFLAHDTRLNRRVALKLLRAGDNLRPEALGRFEQEARAASALTHPNIAVVYDIGEHDGRLFIAMEHVEGRTLAEHLRGGPLSTRDVISIVCQIAEALQAAHAVGIVHRDVKPANVMITPAAQVKVLDFGLAKFASADAGAAGDDTRVMTGAHVVMGTAAYMSPEQSLGAVVDRRTDLFSLGVVLYEAATGRLPFGGATSFEMMDRIRHGEPTGMTSPAGRVPEEFERIVRKCLAKAPSDRYQSAGELVTDLRILERQSDPAHAALVADRSAHNLPADLTTFVGRLKEVEHVMALLGSARLVTLTGAGGSGKTRLAQQAGARVVGTVAHGAWFVDLASTTNPDLLVNVVARVLDVPEKPGATMVETLLAWLQPRQLLLILDNCEHLVDACAALAESTLRQARSLRILATSREALSVPGEAVWRVPPLAVPAESEAPDPDAMLAFDAIRLFVDRARAVASFQFTSENAAAVADICRRLDGVPLAIELAAARTKLLSVGQIRERLNDRFRLLAGGGRTVVARQRTLEATVDWSYELLTDVERRLLARLSVFSGGWTLEAAEQVCGGRGIEERDILDLLARLVDKSLVIVDEAGSEPRYRLLETIRQYARDRLVQSGEIASLGHAHLDYFLALARDAEPELIGRNQAAWLGRLGVEHDNLRTSLDWSLAEPARRADGLALAVCLWWFWTKRDYYSEGRQRLERALAAQDDVPAAVEARALIGLVHLASFAGDFEACRAIADRALVAARTAADGWAEAYALDFAAILEVEGGGDRARARQLAQEAHDVARRTTARLAWQPLALSGRLLGYDALQAGRLDDAGRWFEDVIASQRKEGDTWSTGIISGDLAGLRVLQGRHDEARACAREALSCAQAIRDRRGVGWCLQTFAMLEAAAGRARRAAWLYGAGQAVLESVGATGQMHVTQVQDRFLAPAREALGEAAFFDAAAEGRAAPIAQIMEIDPGAFASA
jgi:non-specific serine/threonine protein kinase